MDNRIAVIGVVVMRRSEAAKKVNAIISDFGDMIVGRMGVPHRERGLSVIALICDGTNDDIGALTGKLGSIDGIKVKAAVTF
ncbi:MAG: iron-only hydrogenase system regulator [Firmicutes bacterium]|nr:iron-only hydrogenase system regulator [Dethiobacter sp.]MBS3888112.1 iron-only hydrogenase system regulator [Bacillota bacterium]MBS4054556.1 iron-only hydrogenase system regulator [Thermaerobacter sp.]